MKHDMMIATKPHADPGEKLLRMAAQIAEFFQSYPMDQAAAGVARHINRYWTPRMREQFLNTAPTTADLSPLLRNALGLIKRPNINN
jgi:formate dehydrogenase subunit delta